MREMSTEEMGSIAVGAGWTWCGIAVGMTIGASLLYGGVGFALTANKAFVACIVPAVM